MFRKKYITKLEDENQYLKLVNEDLEGKLNDKKKCNLKCLQTNYPFKK